MKPSFLRRASRIAAIWVLGYLLLSPLAQSAQNPANSSTGPRTRQLLNWLSDLKTRPTQKIVSGQFVSPNYGRPERGFPTVQDAWNYHIEDLENVTSKYVGLAGFDLSNRTYKGGTASQNMPGCNNIKALSQSHYNQGGIISLTWHSGNPFTLENAWSTVPSGRSLIELTQSGNSYNAQWMIWLSTVGDCLEWYKSQGIPVIWRPLHELDDTFWWGTVSTGEFKDLWRHMYNYLAITRGLNNLIWTWSPHVYASASTLDLKYPGDSYVDILAMDRYSDAITSSSAYNWMNAKGNKVILFGEIGQINGRPTKWDTTRILTEINAYFPSVVGFMSWMKTGTDFSLFGNLNASVLLNDPKVVTRNGILDYVVDNNSSSIAYTGNWTSSADSSYFNDTKSVASTSGAKAELTFTGTSVAIIVKKLASGGKFDVYIDGAFQTTVDTYSSADKFQQRVYEKAGLSNSQHTIRIQLNGQKNASSSGYFVGLDYFSYQRD
jgi:Glycosyl hydrolase family 26/Carbohydrate esterase 2 N-terminal